MSRARLYAIIASLAVLAGIMVPYLISIIGGNLVPWFTATVTGYYPGLTSTPLHQIPGAPGETGVSGGVPISRLSDYSQLYHLLEVTARRLAEEARLSSLYTWIGRAGVPDVLVSVEAIGGLARVGGVEQGVRVSWTNVQVEGVDELDIVKTDGRIVAVVSNVPGDSSVFLVDLRGRSVASSINLPRGEIAKGLFLLGDRLVVVSEERGVGILKTLNVNGFTFIAHDENVTIRVFDVVDPKTPKLLETIRITGALVDGRMYDGIVYLVVNQPSIAQTGSPLIPVVNDTPLSLDRFIILSGNAVRYVSILALSVTSLDYNVVSLLGGPATRIYMNPPRLYVAVDERPGVLEAYTVALGILASIIGGDGGRRLQELLEAGMVDRALEEARMILSNMGEAGASSLWSKLTSKLSSTTLQDRTVLHVMEVKGLQVKPLGSITVNGLLLDQFAIEEYEGKYLILATTTTYYTIQGSYTPAVSETPSIMPWHYVITCAWIGDQFKCETGVRVTINVCDLDQGHQSCRSVTEVLRRPEALPGAPLISFYVMPRWATNNSVYVVDLGKLEISGSLHGLAPGERVYAARLVKNILFLVTFRVVDPLFAIDISDPSNPKVLGYLKIPGFSEYLHPLPGDMLLGVGVEDGGLKISLFNVSNPLDMREVSKIILGSPGGITSDVLRDHHAITVDLDYNRAYIPVSTMWEPAGGVAVISFKGGRLELITLLDHPGANRVVYVGSELYTISWSSIKVYDVNTLELILVIKLR